MARTKNGADKSETTPAAVAGAIKSLVSPHTNGNGSNGANGNGSKNGNGHHHEPATGLDGPVLTAR